MFATPRRPVGVPKQPPNATTHAFSDRRVWPSRPDLFCPFHGPPAPIQPVRGPGKHQQEPVPTPRGASLNPIEWKSFRNKEFF